MTSGGLGFTETLAQDISQDELDFNDLFLYNPAGDDQFPVGCDKDDPGALFQNNSQPPLLLVENVSTSNQNPPSHSPLTEEDTSGVMFDSLGLTSRSGNIPAPSPRIEITPSGDSVHSQTLRHSPGAKVLGSYRECVSPASSNSSTGWPTGSYSPVASPCVSPSNVGGSVGLSALDLCPGLQGIHTSAHSSPGASPHHSITEETFLLPQQHQCAPAPHPHQRSRSTSPHGKRAYDKAALGPGATPVKQRSRSLSPLPSPHEQQGSHYLHQYQAQSGFQTQIQTSSLSQEENWSSGPSRTVPFVMVQNAHGQTQTQDCVYREVYDWTSEQERVRSGHEIKPETIYMIPPVWAPAHPVHHQPFSGLSVAPLPALEWPLPSQSGHYELVILQQPRSHHRAHYETEGSRGAVKTPRGGHPEVQLCGYQGSAPLRLQAFIGTADERLLKPHAFYQVHRVTGKTVTTPSMERMINGTKVLEIPLEPANHMRVVIDCAGILKLRNADIELRNGETDIGRKNTRVRLVFRAHVPQSGGQFVSLQVASDPIECSQRSAQELPSVERQDLDRCTVLGGQKMVLTGQNFTSASKVIFSEKTQDGQQIWEVEAAVDKDMTQANMLFVEVPPYRNHSICHPAKVNFYIINGKKKRSQPQHFIYTPVIAIKAEPLDDYQPTSYGSSENRSMSSSVRSLYHHVEQDNNNPQLLGVSPTLYHLTTVDPRACLLTPEPLDDQAANFHSGLINSHVLYHTANQHYSNCAAAVHRAFPVAPHSISAKTPVVKLTASPEGGDSFEACSVLRQQTTPCAGKSPQSRNEQGQAQQEKVGCGVEPAGGHCEGWTPERVTIKQENISYAYLEDVNDIIRRDWKGHGGE